MYKAFKLLGVTGASALALGVSLATPMSGYALVSETSLINSGDHADVSSDVSKTQHVNVSNVNTATINQTVGSEVNTGGNSVSGNIGGGTLVTGGAATQTMLKAHANENLVGVSFGSQGSLNGQGTEVVNTGDYAHVDSSWTENKHLNINNSNSAAVTQNFWGKSNTGYNELDGNISHGAGGSKLMTGAATNAVGFDVEVNKNMATVNAGMGSALLQGSETSFTNTGDHASIDNSWNSNHSLHLSNSNAAAVNQSAHNTSNSGHNKLTDGIGGGNMVTGGASFIGSFGVEANKNTVGVAGWGNSMLGTMADLVNTGDHLDASNSLSEVFTASISNSNSLAQHQAFHYKNNSGKNELDGNIGNSGVTGTGGAVGAASAHVEGNTNATVFGSMADVLMFLALGQ